MKTETLVSIHSLSPSLMFLLAAMKDLHIKKPLALYRFVILLRKATVYIPLARYPLPYSLGYVLQCSRQHSINALTEIHELGTICYGAKTSVREKIF